MAGVREVGAKEAPDGFAGVKWWDVWGMTPVEDVTDLNREEFVKVRRVLRRKRDEVAGVKVRVRDGGGRLVARRRELWLPGLSVTNLADGMDFGGRLIGWAQS